MEDLININAGYLFLDELHQYNMANGEKNVIEKICDIIRPFVDEVRVDIMGNIIAHKKGGGEKLMLVAHSDVVSLMITYIDESGFLYFKPYGCIDSSILPCKCVTVVNEKKRIHGIIGKKPVHLLQDESIQNTSWENLWIDIGARNKAEAESIIEIGNLAYFKSGRCELENGLISDSGLDNRIGVNILLNIARIISNISLNKDIYIVFSNQEEVGMRGAMVVSNAIKPDISVVVDMAHATDYPGMSPMKYGDIKLGKGCILSKGMNVNNELYNLLRKIAKEKNISFQILPDPYPTGTDAKVIQVSNCGVKTAVVSVPCRYMHTPYEVVSIDDCNAVLGLLCEFVKK